MWRRRRVVTTTTDARGRSRNAVDGRSRDGSVRRWRRARRRARTRRRSTRSSRSTPSSRPRRRARRRRPTRACASSRRSTRSSRPRRASGHRRAMDDRSLPPSVADAISKRALRIARPKTVCARRITALRFTTTKRHGRLVIGCTCRAAATRRRRPPRVIDRPTQLGVYETNILKLMDDSNAAAQAAARNAPPDTARQLAALQAGRRRRGGRTCGDTRQEDCVSRRRDCVSRKARPLRVLPRVRIASRCATRYRERRCSTTHATADAPRRQ